MTEEELAPFEDPMIVRTCVKCGNWDRMSVTWKVGEYTGDVLTDMQQGRHEYLRWTCDSCGYNWKTKTKDAE